MAKRVTEPEFWARTTRADNGCWVWTGTRHKDGYGEIGFRRKLWLAHRLAWQFTHGDIPAGAQILHRCDNPPCINPDHLFLGTQVDNMRDMRIKGRRRGRNVGEANGRAALSWAKVAEIRSLYAANPKPRQVDLASRFCVSQSMISAVIRRANWPTPT